MSRDTADYEERDEDARDTLTAQEKRSIAALRRVAANWPRSLTIASMGGALVVVHTGDERFTDGSAGERSDAILADIDGIPNTGGDW